MVYALPDSMDNGFFFVFAFAFVLAGFRFGFAPVVGFVDILRSLSFSVNYGTGILDSLTFNLSLLPSYRLASIIV